MTDKPKVGVLVASNFFAAMQNKSIPLCAIYHKHWKDSLEMIALWLRFEMNTI